MEDVLKGRLGGAEGFDVRCTLEGDRIAGRAGGRLHGKDIDLEITETGVVGLVGGQAVRVELDGGELRGEVGGQPITLRGVDRVTGFFGQPIVGWNIVAQQVGEKLVGRLGSTVLGRDFEFDLGSAPGWVGTLVAVVAFYALEPRAAVGR